MQKTAGIKKNPTEKAVATKDDKARAKSSTKDEKPKPEKSEKPPKENKKTQKEDKKEKDGPVVKRGKNPYMFFLQENRDKVKKENDGVNNKELIKIIGNKWNSLSADEKKKYNDMAEKDKERYEKELENSGLKIVIKKIKKK